MGSSDDPTPYSYIISKYYDLINSTVSATFNNFKFQLFLVNTDEVDPAQPFINMERFMELIKQDA
jgi:hypothetical protein